VSSATAVPLKFDETEASLTPLIAALDEASKQQ